MRARRAAAMVIGALLAASAGSGCTISAVSVSTQERDHQLVKRLNVVTIHGQDEGKSLVRVFDGTAEDENTFSLLQLGSWTRENNRPQSGTSRSAGPGSPGFHFSVGN